MNIVNIPNHEERNESSIRVHISYPNGEVVVKQSFDRKTSSIIRNVALKNWDKAANAVFNHEDIREHLPDGLRRKLSSEFQSLSSDSILTGTSPVTRQQRSDSTACAVETRYFLASLVRSCP